MSENKLEQEIEDFKRNYKVEDPKAVNVIVPIDKKDIDDVTAIVFLNGLKAIAEAVGREQKLYIKPAVKVTRVTVGGDNDIQETELEALLIGFIYAEPEGEWKSREELQRERILEYKKEREEEARRYAEDYDRMRKQEDESNNG